MTLLSLLLAALLGAGPGPSPTDVLHSWDERRSAAWAAADPDALRRLYAPGSPTGAADVAMLRAWRARGLRVEDLRMQLLSVTVREDTGARLVLVVTDRVASGVAVGGGVRRELPRDAASTRRLVLVQAAGEWRVAQASPARTTSSTVRSRNR